jgi:hypothetical protein
VGDGVRGSSEFQLAQLLQGQTGYDVMGDAVM